MGVRRSVPALGLALGQVLAVLLAVVPPAFAHAPAAATGDTDRARARAAAIRDEVAALQRRLDRLAEQAEAAYARLGESVTEQVLAERAADAAATASGAAQAAHAARVRALYAQGGTAVLYATLLDARDPADVVTRYRTVTAVFGQDRAAEQQAGISLAAAARSASAADRQVRDRVALERRERAVTAQTQALLARQQALLAGADVEVARLLERDRQQAAQAALARAALDAGTDRGSAPATAPATATAAFVPRAGVRYACPVGPVHSFVDTWGAPRSGGRRHEGTDVFAPYGSGVYAIADGVTDRVGDDGGRGGLRLWVRADNGDRFYYTHNSELLVRPGQRVRAGQLVARVGRSGDAASTPPHVHFETHPQGGAAVDSYPFLRAACTGGR